MGADMSPFEELQTRAEVDMMATQTSRHKATEKPESRHCLAFQPGNDSARCQL